MLFRFSSRFLLLLPLSLGAVRAADTPSVAVAALVSDVLSGNPELRFYEAEIAAAKAGVQRAGVLAEPELAVELGRKRVRDATGAFAAEGTAWSVSVTQTFEWPGRLALRKAIANRQVELAELGLRRFRAALDARARVLAYGLRAADTKAAAAREVADRFAALKETFLAREPGGITPQLEARVIEASELALQRRATAAELELQAALLELNQLRGQPATTPLRVDAPSLRFGDAPPVESLLASARENNFDFLIRRTELEQQTSAVRLARHERFPAVSVGPYYSQERAGERETTVGLAVSLPLTVTGQRRADAAVAESRRHQADVAQQVTWRELEREIVLAAQGFATKSAEVRRWAPEAIRQFRDAAALADRHYRLGAVPVGTYVELQNAYLEAVEALLDTEREALEAGLRLRQLTGVDFTLVEASP